MKKYVFAAALALVLGACGQAADRPAAIATATQEEPETLPFPDGRPRAYFVNLANGDSVRTPFRVVFGLSGMGVAPAGVDASNTGHHHLLIDATLSAEERAYAIPADDNHVHFGGGQTEAVLTLPPGEHTLQLVLGDRGHTLFNPSVESEVITINVHAAE